MDVKKFILVGNGNPIVRQIPLKVAHMPSQLSPKQEPIYDHAVQLVTTKPRTVFNSQSNSELHDYLEKGEVSDDDLAKPPRKKSCLSHLTDSEKNLRRKMKNRESAQSARDRKKCYLESLEHRVKTLEDEKLTLQQAKCFVEQKCYKLEEDNEKLKVQLRSVKLSSTAANSAVVRSTSDNNSQHWESVCRDLMRQKEELENRLQFVEEKYQVTTSEASNSSAVTRSYKCGTSSSSGSQMEQLECLVPIENEVEVVTSEESFESAALSPVSPQQNRFVHAMTALLSLLLLSTKCPPVSADCTTLLEQVLKKTYKEGKLDCRAQKAILHRTIARSKSKSPHHNFPPLQKKPP